jgi:hypothetical protein
MVMSTFNGVVTRVKEGRKCDRVKEGRGGDLVKEGLDWHVCSMAWEVGGGRHGATAGKGRR